MITHCQVSEESSFAFEFSVVKRNRTFINFRIFIHYILLIERDQIRKYVVVCFVLVSSGM